MPEAFYADGHEGDADNLMAPTVEECVGLLASEGRRIAAEAFIRLVEHSALFAWECLSFHGAGTVTFPCERERSVSAYLVFVTSRHFRDLSNWN